MGTAKNVPKIRKLFNPGNNYRLGTIFELEIFGYSYRRPILSGFSFIYPVSDKMDYTVQYIQLSIIKITNIQTMLF